MNRRNRINLSRYLCIIIIWWSVQLPLSGHCFWTEDTVNAHTTNTSYQPTQQDIETMVVLADKLALLAVDNMEKVQTIEKKLATLQMSKAILQNPKYRWYVEQLSTHIQQLLHREFLKTLDYETDNSLTKFVTQSRWLTNPQYIPNDLVTIQDNHALQNNDHTPQQLRADAARALQLLADAYYQEIQQPLLINSTYRSYRQQEQIYTHCHIQNWCAKPWHSEHQTWLAVDISSLHWERFTWMQHNAHKYWFHQSYQWWVMHNEFAKETRHRRYLWTTLATFLYEESMTFSQRYYYNNF